MAKRKYFISLSSEERGQLLSIVTKGTCSARTIRRAQVLLNLDGVEEFQHQKESLSQILEISQNTIHKIVKRYQTQGIDCIYRKKRSTPPKAGKITGEVEAHLIALACHNPRGLL